MTPEQVREEIAKDDATLQQVHNITDRYRRHSVDITDGPMSFEDELRDFDRSFRRARWAWVAIGVLVVTYVVWRWVSGGGM